MESKSENVPAFGVVENASDANTFNSFLQIFKTSSNNFTHISIFPTEIRYEIMPHKIGIFWQKYCEEIQKGTKLYIAEKNDLITPLILDFEFRFKTQVDINKLFKFSLISHVQQILLQTHQISDNKPELLCCILESKAWNKLDEVCYSIILQFPYCRINVSDSYERIIKNLSNELLEKIVIDKLGINPSSLNLNTYTLIKPILMYGSVSHSRESIKTLTGIYGVIERDHIDGLCDPDSLDIELSLQLKNHHDKVSGYITDEILNRDAIFKLPLALSVKFWNGVIRIKDYNSGQKVVKLKINSKCNNLLDDTERENLKRFDSGYADIFQSYMKDNIICIDSKHGIYMIWDENDLERIWNQRDQVHLLPYINKVLESLLKNVLNNLIKEFVRLDEKNRKGQELLEEESKKLDSIENEIKNWTKQIRYIQSTKGQQNIERQLRPRHYNNKFVEKLNNFGDNFPLRDGKMINLRTEEVRYRIKEDYCTCYCPIKYNKDADQTGMINLMNSYFAPKITKNMNEEEKEKNIKFTETYISFIQRMLGYMISGNNKAKKFFIWFGPKADNGKSTLLRLLGLILSHLFCALDSDIILKKAESHQSDGVHPASKAQMIGKFLGAVVENDKSGTLNNLMIKKILGGDKMNACHKYANNIEFTPILKLLLITNVLPIVDSVGKDIWKKILVIKFNVEFKDNPNENNKYEKQINEDYEEIFNNEKFLEGAFLWIVKGSKMYFEQKLNPPEYVQTKTKNYQESKDYFSQFFNQNYEISSNINDQISFDESYSAYQFWFSENCEGKVIPRKDWSKTMKTKKVEKYRQTSDKKLVVFRGIKKKTPEEEKKKPEKKSEEKDK